jgi:nucleoside-diphosphate-sugar epimerase
MERERILITGPGGRVGPHILPLLREKYALRLVDVKPLPLEGDDELAQVDIRDTEAMTHACEGMRAVIHLAAISDEDDFRTKLLPVNIDGVYSIFEAAHRARVQKVVFTSTMQTMLNYGAGNWVTTQMPARPFTIYACTKLFGEALARYYADRRGMAAICIRLAWFQNYGSENLRTQPHMWREWISPRDFASLLDKSIQTQLKFGVFFGVSNNTGRYWDISNAKESLGWEPEDDAFKLAPR